MSKIYIDGVELFPFAGEPVEMSEEETLFLRELAEVGIQELVSEEVRIPTWPRRLVQVSAVVAQTFLIPGGGRSLEPWGVPGAARLLKDYLFGHVGGLKVFDGGKGLTTAKQLLVKICQAYVQVCPNRETQAYLGIYDLLKPAE